MTAVKVIFVIIVAIVLPVITEAITLCLDVRIESPTRLKRVIFLAWAKTSGAILYGVLFYALGLLG